MIEQMMHDMVCHNDNHELMHASATISSDHVHEDHRMKLLFRKISFCFIFLLRLQHSRQICHSFQEQHVPKNPKKSNFRVASLCFLFLRRLHAFESQFQNTSTQHHETKASFRVASLCFVFLRRLHAFETHFSRHSTSNGKETKNKSRKQKRNYSTKQKCTCCKLNTESEHGEEQTRTILTNTFRDIVPKLSRILVNQDPFSSSSIWTSKNRPANWPKDLPWKDPNNKPKDTFEILEKRMHILQELCAGKQIPLDIAKEVKAYKEYRQQVQCHLIGDISKLQVIRQKRKVTHKLTAAMRDFAEVVQWHGPPERSDDLEREARNLRGVLYNCHPGSSHLSLQFDEIFYAIANVEGSDESPDQYMQQFAHQGHADKKHHPSSVYRGLKRSSSPFWKQENLDLDTVKKKYIM